MPIYSGCKNNFYITTYNELYDNSDYARYICKDNLDGFMMVKNNPLEMILYNRDGSIASMCGNGIRCLINYCYDNKLIKNEINIVKTLSGNVYTKIISTNPFLTYVRLTTPKYTYIDNKEYANEEILVNNHIYKITLVNVGVWHGIIIPSNFEECVENAKDIHNLEQFKDILNVDIVKINGNEIYLKTYERGIGFTKACGTGTAATFISLLKLGIINDNQVSINQEGGTIIAGIDQDGIYIIGPSIHGE